MSEQKLVKITLNDYEIDGKESGELRLYGIDFKAKDGKLTASVHADVAKSMKDAKLAK